MDAAAQEQDRRSYASVQQQNRGSLQTDLVHQDQAAGQDSDDSQEALNTAVTLRLDGATLEEALESIAAKSGLNLVYGSQTVAVGKTMTLDLEGVTAHEALHEVLKDTGLRIRVLSGDQVVVVHRQEKTPGPQDVESTDRRASLSSQVAQLSLAHDSSPKPRVQTGTISGTVTDAQSGEPIPGVNVLVQGTQMGAATGAQGQYTISSVEEGTYTLQASFVGYESQTRENVQVEANQTTQINFQLQRGAQGLDEVVVVGYGTQEEESISGSVSEVEAGEITEVPVANNSDKLAGRVPGLVTKQTSGVPGNDFRSLSIRGFGDPLVLVDGVEQPFTRVDPHSIESVTVLKDASAAIYGARAGNGVILVTTKRGNEGEPQFNYNSSATVQQPTFIPDHVSAGQYAELRREGELNYGLEPSFTQEEIQRYKEEDGPAYQSYDWYDALLRTWTPQTEQNINVQGGTDNVNYFVSTSYLNQASAFESGDLNFERWSARSNLDIDVSENLTAALDLSYRREFRERPGQGLGDIWIEMNTASPLLPPILPDEDRAAFSGFTTRSPIASSEREFSGFTENKQEYVNGNLRLDYDLPFVDGLTAKGELSYFFESNYVKDFSKPYEVWRYDVENDEYISRGTNGGGTTNLNEDFNRFQKFRPSLSLEYSNSFGPHSIDGLAITEWITSSGLNIGASRQNLLSPQLPFLFVGGDENKDNYGNASDARRHSYIGRVNYSYDGRYILEGIFRADASHKFPEDSRWGFFPSASAAWRLSEEAFIEDNLSFVENLKLRLSYSQSGDDDVGAFQHLTGYNIRGGATYLIDGGLGRVITPTGLPNQGITWRSMTQYNAGLDGTLWQGLLGFQADVFYRRTEGIFGTPQRDFPSTLGAQLPQRNINVTADRGFELMLSHENTIGDVNYSVSANTGFTREKYLEWAEEDYDEPWEQRVLQNEGNWVRRTIGYVALGTFESQEEIDNWEVDQDQNGNTTLRPGDIKYKDLNGDGEITVRDQKVIGDGTQPNLTYGFNLDVSYKGFSMSALFQGASMFNFIVGGNVRAAFSNGSTPYTFQYEHRWTEENPDAKLPAINGTGQGANENNDIQSSFWLQDGTYLRLKNLNLGYTFPERWIGGLGVQRLRLYVAGSNLLTFNRLGIYDGSFDPESPGFVNGRNYPPHRTVSVGVNLSL